MVLQKIIVRYFLESYRAKTSFKTASLSTPLTSKESCFTCGRVRWTPSTSTIFMCTLASSLRAFRGVKFAGSKFRNYSMNIDANFECIRNQKLPLNSMLKAPSTSVRRAFTAFVRVADAITNWVCGGLVPISELCINDVLRFNTDRRIALVQYIWSMFWFRISYLNL